MRSPIAVYIFISLSVGLCAGVYGQSVDQICFDSWENDDAVIKACSAVITENSRPAAEIAKALNKRGLSFRMKASLTGMSAEEKQKFQSLAIADYDKAIGLEPIWLYYHNRAEAKRQWRENASALPDAEKAVELVRNDRSIESFDHANVYATRGAIYLALGQKAKAADDFLTAYRINPDSEDARDGLRAVGVQPNRAVEWVKSFFIKE